MSSHVEHPSGYEKSDISLSQVLLVATVGIAVLVICIIGVNEWFIMERESETQRVVLGPENPALIALRAQENEALLSYKMIDTATGSVRIPVERAMELLAEEYHARQMVSQVK